ncbi:hypothetical protein U1Q18_017053 [Sarracenia purpurea var. burkii]
MPQGRVARCRRLVSGIGPFFVQPSPLWSSALMLRSFAAQKSPQRGSVLMLRTLDAQLSPAQPSPLWSSTLMLSSFAAQPSPLRSSTLMLSSFVAQPSPAQPSPLRSSVPTGLIDLLGSVLLGSVPKDEKPNPEGGGDNGFAIEE